MLTKLTLEDIGEQELSDIQVLMAEMKPGSLSDTLTPRLFKIGHIVLHVDALMDITCDYDHRSSCGVVNATISYFRTLVKPVNKSGSDDPTFKAIDWSPFDPSAENIIACMCGGPEFSSHTKVVSADTELRTYTRQPCPTCGSHHNVRVATHQPSL